MVNDEIQIVSNENGEPTAVIVPIDLWREIESERETAHLLKSERMKSRLLSAKGRQDGISWEDVFADLGVDSDESPVPMPGLGRLLREPGFFDIEPDPSGETR